MSQQRKPLLTLTEAIKLYGAERVKFPRPRFVDEGFCEWCGQPIENRRRKSCCCEEHSEKFNIATSPVYYANQGSAGGYRGHILRRDKFTCQVCGEFHVKYSEYGIPLPTTDGQLDVHHIKPVAEGGTDSPDNLMTVCRTCHKKITAEWQKEIKQKESDIDLFGQKVFLSEEEAAAHYDDFLDGTRKAMQFFGFKVGDKLYIPEKEAEGGSDKMAFRIVTAIGSDEQGPFFQVNAPNAYDAQYKYRDMDDFFCLTEGAARELWNYLWDAYRGKSQEKSLGDSQKP